MLLENITHDKKIVNIIYIPLIKLLYFWMISSFELLDIYIIFFIFYIVFDND